MAQHSYYFLLLDEIHGWRNGDTFLLSLYRQPLRGTPPGSEPQASDLYAMTAPTWKAAPVSKGLHAQEFLAKQYSRLTELQNAAGDALESMGASPPPAPEQAGTGWHNWLTSEISDIRTDGSEIVVPLEDKGEKDGGFPLTLFRPRARSIQPLRGIKMGEGTAVRFWEDWIVAWNIHAADRPKVHFIRSDNPEQRLTLPGDMFLGTRKNPLKSERLR